MVLRRKSSFWKKESVYANDSATRSTPALSRATASPALPASPLFPPSSPQPTASSPTTKQGFFASVKAAFSKTKRTTLKPQSAPSTPVFDPLPPYAASTACSTPRTSFDYDSPGSSPEVIQHPQLIPQFLADPDSTPRLGSLTCEPVVISPPFDPAFERAAESDADSEWEPTQPGSLLPHGRPRPLKGARSREALHASRIPSIRLDGISMDDVFRDIEQKLGIGIPSVYLERPLPALPGLALSADIAAKQASLGERRRSRRISRPVSIASNSSSSTIRAPTPAPSNTISDLAEAASERAVSPSPSRSSLAYMSRLSMDLDQERAEIVVAQSARPSTATEIRYSTASEVIEEPSSPTPTTPRRSSLNATVRFSTTPTGTPKLGSLPELQVLPPTPVISQRGFQPSSPQSPAPEVFAFPRPAPTPPVARKPRITSQNALEKYNITLATPPLSPSSSLGSVVSDGSLNTSASETDMTDEEAHAAASCKSARSSCDVDGLLLDLARPLTPLDAMPGRDISYSSALDALQLQFGGVIRSSSITRSESIRSFASEDSDGQFADAPHFVDEAIPFRATISSVDHRMSTGGDLGIYLPSAEDDEWEEEAVTPTNASFAKAERLRHWRTGSIDSIIEDDEYDGQVSICDRVPVGFAL